MNPLFIRSLRFAMIAITGMLFVCGVPAVKAAHGPGSTYRHQDQSWIWELLERWFGRGEREKERPPQINNGNPVPNIANDDDSSNFLKARIAEEAQQDHGANYAEALQSYESYADRLAKTLGTLTPGEQSEVFYGQ